MTALEQAARDVDAYLQIDDDVLEFQHTGMVAVPIPRMVKLRKALRATARQNERPHRCGREGCGEADVRFSRTTEPHIDNSGNPYLASLLYGDANEHACKSLEPVRADQMCLACGVVADLAVHRCAGDEPVAVKRARYPGPGYVGWMHTLGYGRLDEEDEESLPTPAQVQHAKSWGYDL